MLGAGQSEFAMRLLSVFAGMVTVVAVGRCASHPASRLLAMSLAALSSVCISLSQETRMYSLLVCFCALAVAQMLRCLRANTQRTQWAWVLWGIFNIAAFGTHVLGAIVFGAQVLVVLAIFLASRRRWPGSWFLAVALPCGLGMMAVLAWIVSVGQSYGTTYTGQLNYLTTLQQSLAALALPRLQPESWQMAATLVVGALLCATLAWRGSRVMGGIVLISVLGIAALCAITGKFAARYPAIVAPLFLAAISELILGERTQHTNTSAWSAPPPPGDKSPSHKTAPAEPGFVRAITQVIATLAVIAIGSFSAWHWRTSPAYANEDFRGAAQFIRANVKDDEAVLLVSGHFAPVFAYYFGERGWHALPNDPVLNVRNSLSFDSAMPALNTALRGKRGAWLLLWQDPVIDPSALTQALLRRQANRLQPEPNTPQFTGLKLHHYRFNQPYQPLPETMPTLNSKLEALGQSRGLLGLGCHPFRNPHMGDAYLEIFCFWQIEPKNNLPYDTQVSLRLLGPNGQILTQSDQQLAPDGLPTTRFDKELTAIYFVPLPSSVAAGSYSLQAIPYTPEGEVSPRATTKVDVEPGEQK
jgi:hypothetical protein